MSKHTRPLKPLSQTDIAKLRLLWALAHNPWGVRLRAVDEVSRLLEEAHGLWLR